MIDTLIDGRRLQFKFDGTLLSPGDGATGTWKTEAGGGTPANRLTFTLPDQTPSQLKIDYDINADNQLTMAVPVQPGVSTAVGPVAVPGRIFADDPNDIQYATLAADGTVSPYRIFVYGTLRLEQRTDQLILKLRESGREIVIQGDRPNANCLISDAFQQPGQDTIDRLRFTAKTRNKVGTIAKLFVADIQFTGRWNFVDGKLTFAARYTNAGGQPNTMVALVGSYKATNFGLVFSSTAAGKQFTFKIDSRFQVSGLTGEWELQLGYSPQSRFASGNFTAKANLPVGKNGELAIQGTVKFGGAGGQLSLEVDLQATYSFANGQLLFSVKAGPAGYSLYFGGQFKVGANGTITFALNYGPSGVTGKLAIELGQLGNKNVTAGLELILSRSGRQVTIDVGVAFSVTWVNGTMIAA